MAQHKDKCVPFIILIVYVDAMGYHTWSLKETRKAPEELPVDRARIWPREDLRFNLQHQPQNIKSQGMEKNQTENKGKIQRGRQFT